MPITASPVVKPLDLRPGDRLPSGATVTGLPGLLTKSKNKGKVAVPVDMSGGLLILDPEPGFHVDREVPTAEERDAFREADRTFRNVVDVVDARSALRRALDDLDA